MVDPEIPVGIMRRINHGTDIIQFFCHGAVLLPHSLCILPAANHRPEHIGRYKKPFFAQFLVCIIHKFLNDVLTASPLCHLRVKHHLVHALFGTEADVIKLDFVKSSLPGHLSDLNQIIPHFFLIRVHPGQLVPVPEYGSVCQFQAPLRHSFCQIRISKSRDPGDHVNAVLL